MKKIIWITNGWLHDLGGGRTIASARIIKYLADQGYKITVLDFERRIKEIKKNQNNIIRHSNINFLHQFLKTNKGVLLSSLKILRQEKPDIVICSSFSYIDLFILIVFRIMYPKNNRPKIILFEHSFPPASILNQPDIFKYGYFILAKFLYRHFDYIVVTTKRLKSYFINIYKTFPKKITVIPYPVIGPHFNLQIKESVSERIFKKSDYKIIITAARLDLIQKDYLTLFDAFALILEKKKNVGLVILGAGRDEAIIKNYAKSLGISSNVFFLGYKKNPYKYISRADVFVLSSKFEGTGMVLVEAMAAGVPVIATDSPVGPFETLGGGKDGILIPVGNKLKMAEKIIELLIYEKKRRMLIREGFKKAHDFTFKKAFKQWSQYLMEI